MNSLAIYSILYGDHFGFISMIKHKNAQILVSTNKTNSTQIIRDVPFPFYLV